MNRKLHRIVFSRKRGPWKAAALMALGFAPLAVQSQVRGDPSAPQRQRPTVLLAPNGVPLVNIQTPSAAGVSRNTYRQFDVDAAGAILNNSRTAIRTELGGWVQANPWLAQGTARVILNEVNSTDPSLLRGYIEVAGPRAQVVVANPSGIQVQGAGFINASQAVLTTGRLSLVNGLLAGYRVESGTIAIDGRGLDTRDADYTRILARAFKLNAGVWGQDVQVVTGANDISSDAAAAPQARPVDADTGAGGVVGTATPPVTSATPAVAIDVSRLGGMYAGKIRLVGTEAGVGMRHDGTLSASAGDIVIDHQGWLSLGGQTQASGSVTALAGGDITNTGTTLAGQTLALQTRQQLLNTGLIAGRRVDIDVGSLANQPTEGRGGEIWQTGAQAFEVQAGSLRNAPGGRIGEIRQRPPSGGAGGATPSPIPDPATATVPAPVPAPDAATGTQDPPAGGTPAPLPAGRLVVRGMLDNAGGTLGASGATDMHVADGLDNAGEWVVRHLQLETGRFDNREGALLQAATLAVQATDAVNRGTLLASQALALSAQTIDNQARGLINAGTTRLKAAQSLTNRGIIDGVRTEVDAADLRNLGTGRVFGDDIALAATSLLNDSEAVDGVPTAATIAARQRLDIGARHITNREGALIFSAGSLHVGGALDANGQATGEAETLDNDSATIESLGDMRLAARTLRNTNAHFTSQLQVVSGPTAMTLIQPGGSTVRIPAGNLYRVDWDRAWDYRYDTTPDPYDGVPVRLGATPIPALGEMRCTDHADEATCARIAGADYLPDDPAWAYFGLTPPSAEPPPPAMAEPVPPASPQQPQPTDPAWEAYRAQRAAYDEAWQQHQASHAQWDAQTDAAYAQLDARIEAYNQQFQGAGIREWTQYNVQRTILETRVTRSAPGQILAGGSLDLAGQSLLNDKSRILAGGSIGGDLDALRNAPAQGEHVEQESGTVQSSWVYTKRGGKLRTGSRHSYREFSGAAPYSPPDAVTTIDLGVGEVQEHRATLSQRQAPAATRPLQGQGAAAIALSGSSLFHVNPDSTAGYLVETDPRFASYRAWLGSDYLLQASGHDPATTQKRLGDGFHEQRLVREQVATLTGRRFLGHWQDDEAQYQALMASGATFARVHSLRPGIALSAAQVAQLTADIVWLVEQAVTLPDGRQTTALVPRVYLAPRAGDLGADGQLLGSVLSGRDLQLRLRGDLDNAGSIAGRQLVRLDAANLRNSGLVQGADVAVRAGLDITLEGGRLQAQDRLVAQAGRDLRIASTTRSAERRAGANQFSRSDIDRVAGLYVSGAAGVLVASAARDVELQAAVIGNQGRGPTAVLAGRDLALTTVTTGSRQDIHWTANNNLSQSGSQEQGSQVRSAGDVVLQAGQDVRARAADVQAEGHLALAAGGSVTIEAGQTQSHLAEAREVRSRGMLSRSSTVTRSSSSSTQAAGSELGGQTVTVQAGRDIRVQGSSVISDEGTQLDAGGDVRIVAQETQGSSSHFQQTTKSGLFSSGGMGVTLGKQERSVDQAQEQTAAAASTVGSIGGNVRITAGQAYTQVGSDVIAPAGDIGIHAQRVDIQEARERDAELVEQRFRQSGLTVAVTSPVLSSLQTARDQLQAAGRTGSDRMRLLAGANALMNADQAVGAVRAGQGDANGQVPTGRMDANGNPEMADANAADKAGGIGISVSLGSASSKSAQSAQADTARGSRVEAGGNVRIEARGAGEGSDVTVRGSVVRAGGVAALKAEDDVLLLAATETREQQSSSSSRSGSVGVAIQLGNGGGGIGVTASASRGAGQGSGSGTRHVNTHVEGQQVVLDSGGDTTLRGAVVSGEQVTTRIAGDLVIESLQDTDRYRESSRQVGGSVMIGAGGGGSLHAGRTRIDSDYLSVGEQSAIRAGDGGFQVDVQGRTELVGGQVTSTQAAIDGNRNRFDSAGGVTTTDLHNAASYGARSTSLGLAGGVPKPGASPGAGLSGGGLGSDGGNASSTTTAGISGVAGDTRARTGDAGTQLAAIFDKNRVSAQVQAQVAITGEFGKQASRVAGNFADKKLDDAKAVGDREGVEAWKEGGSARSALHALVGGLAGGIPGAVGAGAGSAAAPLIDQLQVALAESLQSAGMPPAVSNTISSLAGGATAATIGAAASGGSTAGAMTAFNADMNNRQLHSKELDAIKRAAMGDKPTEERLKRAACFAVRCWAQYPEGSQDREANFVTALEAQTLVKELGWVYSQRRSDDLFTYGGLDLLIDGTRSQVLPVAGNGMKVAGGGVAVFTGATICATTGLGCTAGVPLALMGASEATEGWTGLYNQFQGNGPAGFNPVRAGLNLASPVYGDAMYDVLYLTASVGSLMARVPLKVGASDGISRTNSMFGATVRRADNAIVNPVTGKVLLQPSAARAVTTVGAGAKVPVLIEDIEKIRGGK